METEKLYYADPFLREFTARILTCEKGPKGGFLVTLDRTAFYPEGGGQPCDFGTLDGKSVTDVQEKDGVIFHKVEKSVEIGQNVTGILDWERRFDHMQQHSGEHIISGILCDAFHCDNVGFHMGSDVVTIDYNADISWEQALEAQAKANAVIAADTPFVITYPSAEELKTIDYRSKKELFGQVRIVTVPGADCCACCGTHVLRCGQVGLVKVLSVQKFREGVRIEIVCGNRALRLFDTVYEQNRAVAQSLSVKPEATAAAVARTLGELSDAKTRCAELEEQHFLELSKTYAGAGDTVLFFSPMPSDAVRKLTDAVAKQCGGLAAVFAGPEETDKYNYALIRADGADISALVKSMNAALSGRGGGRNGFAQGSVRAEKTDIQAFFKQQ
ncbi:MAG: alanine--tRNA ligase-related protein [Oscillibacter sp.]|jgi:alanyl-tRNA synthetase|nr:alanine--tRNA ligase-related protein [Oscillibacter sp.]